MPITHESRLITQKKANELADTLLFERQVVIKPGWTITMTDHHYITAFSGKTIAQINCHTFSTRMAVDVALVLACIRIAQ